eukprot:s809_g3.t1
MGLFTSGCVVADHMLQFGSPQFLADMARSPKYSLDLVEVDAVGGGTDWVALCAVRARLQDDPRAERELPPGLASLRAAAEQAWRRQRDGGDASRLHYRNFVTGGAAAAGQHCLRKRWLNAVDPTGGCLHYLAAVQERHETSDHLTKAYVQESAGRFMLKAEFFSDLAISAEHRPRFLRWITTTYTTASTDESDLKCLDEQIFEDFGIEEAEHRALFRNWFVRFCGVRPADGEEELRER